jgi:hypothetical protein
MYLETIYHTLADGENAKFTILSRVINKQIFYYAQIINMDLNIYKNKSPAEQEKFYGMEIFNGKGKSINHSDKEIL